MQSSTPRQNPNPPSLSPPPRLAQAIQRIRDIPSLPEVVSEVVALMAQPGTSAAAIADLISYDPGLTSRVLRLVNSSAFGVPRQISSVQHGIMMLGFNTVRGMVLSASVFKVFAQADSDATPCLDHRQFWKHSMATAMVARMLADAHNLPEKDDAFSAGMLHDIGKLLLDVYFRKDYAHVLSTARLNQRPVYGSRFVAVEQSCLQTDHAAMGALLAERWTMPVPIVQTIRYHHTVEAAEQCQALVAVVALANELVHAHQDQAGVWDAAQIDPALLEVLRLSVEDVERLHHQAKPEIEQVDALLESLGST